MNIFNQKFPCNTSVKSHLITAAGFGIFIMIFLLVFKPFQLDTLRPWARLFLVCSVYAFTTFTCIMAAALIMPRIFPFFFTEEKWTTGKQILLISGVLVLVGFANYAVSPLIVNTHYSFSDFLWFQGSAILVGFLPITIYILIRQNSLLRKFEKDAALLEKKLQEKLGNGNNSILAPPGEKKNDLTLIELIGDYQGEKLLLPPGDLYFIAAANNYIKVFYTKGDKLSYSIIRMTMKKAVGTLDNWPDFFRCHRAYIVNLEKVAHVEGNAQGYKIRLSGMEDIIPVSRNLSTEFSDRLLASRNNIASLS